MSTISGVSSSSTSDAWANLKAQRSQMQAKMFAKVDTNGSGGVDKTELQSMLTDMASKTGTTATTISDKQFATMDANGDGSLTSDELGKGMKEIMPPPSTMDFAQSRSDSSTNTSSGSADDLFSKIDTDGNGSVSKAELKTLMDKMKADSGSGSTSSTTASTTTASTSTTSTSSDDMFAKLDANSDGSLSQTEFEAGRPQNSDQTQSSSSTPSASNAPPPPPPGGAGGAGGASSASTTYDPLDTNQDGTVSLAERLAGSTKSTDSKDAVATLMKAIDTDGDNKISASESESFVKQLSSQLEASAQSSSSSDTSSGTQSKKDSVDLAELVKAAYEQTASGLTQQTKGSTLSTLA